jgi:hypothetical protein
MGLLAIIPVFPVSISASDIGIVIPFAKNQDRLLCYLREAQ